MTPTSTSAGTQVDVAAWLQAQASERLIVEMANFNVAANADDGRDWLNAYFDQTRNFFDPQSPYAQFDPELPGYVTNAFDVMTQERQDFVQSFMALAQQPEYWLPQRHAMGLMGCCPSDEALAAAFLGSQIDDLIALAKSQIDTHALWHGHDSSMGDLTRDSFVVLSRDCYNFPCWTVAFTRPLPKGLSLFCVLPGYRYDPLQRKVVVSGAGGDGVWNGGLEPTSKGCAYIPAHRYSVDTWNAGDTEPVFHTRHLLYKIMDPLLKIGGTLAFAAGVKGIFAAAGLQAVDLGLASAQNNAQGLSEMSELATQLKQNDVATLLSACEAQWQSGLDFLTDTYRVLAACNWPEDHPDDVWLDGQIAAYTKLASGEPTTQLSQYIEQLAQPAVCPYGYGHFASLVTLELLNMVTCLTLLTMRDQPCQSYAVDFASHLSVRVDLAGQVVWRVLQDQLAATWCRHSKRGHQDIRTFACPEDGLWYWCDSGWSDAGKEHLVGLITDGWNRKVGGTLRAALAAFGQGDGAAPGLLQLMADWATVRRYWSVTIPILETPNAATLANEAVDWAQNLPWGTYWQAGNQVRYGVRYLNPVTPTPAGIDQVGWSAWWDLAFALPSLVRIPVDGQDRVTDRQLWRQFRRVSDGTILDQEVLTVFSDNTTTSYVDQKG